MTRLHSRVKAGLALALGVLLTGATTVVAMVGPTATASMVSVRPAQVATDPSMLAWWPFHERLGTIAVDLSGNGHNGSVKGATWKP